MEKCRMQMAAQIKDLITNKKLMISIFITSLFAYGFYVSYEFLYIDDTAMYRYIYENRMLRQGRWGSWFLLKLTGYDRIHPFVDKIFALLLLICGILLILGLFKYASGGSYECRKMIMFSCLALSYSLFNELMFYAGMLWSITLNFSLVAIVIWLVYFEKRKKVKWVWAVCILALAIATYEVSAAVYIELVIILMLIEQHYKQQYKAVKDVIRKGIPMGTVLVLAIVFERLMAKGLCIAFGWDLLLRQSIWKISIAQGTIISQMKTLAAGFIINYGIRGLFYFPITEAAVAMGICLVLVCIKFIRGGTVEAFLYFMLLFASMSLSLFSGEVAANRASWEIMAILTAFLFTEVFSSLWKTRVFKIRFAPVCAAALLFVQCNDLNKWEYANYLRDNEEKQVMTAIGNEINKYCDTEKAVVFIGNYTLSDSVREFTHLSRESFQYKAAVKAALLLGLSLQPAYMDDYGYRFNETGCNSIINWGIRAFSETNTELLNYMELLGYSFCQGTPEIMREEEKKSGELPAWPQEGSIIEHDDYIVVNFGRKQ